MATKEIQRSAEQSWTLLDLLDQAPGLFALSDTLIEITEDGAPVVALTGDLKYSNGLVRFAERYPERFFNMGISEQNMVSTAAGMATSGLTPFVADFAKAFPKATLLLTGAGDPFSNAHSEDESVDLKDLERSTLAEALFLEGYAASGQG